VLIISENKTATSQLESIKTLLSLIR